MYLVDLPKIKSSIFQLARPTNIGDDPLCRVNVLGYFEIPYMISKNNTRIFEIVGLFLVCMHYTLCVRTIKFYIIN